MRGRIWFSWRFRIHSGGPLWFLVYLHNASSLKLYRQYQYKWTVINLHDLRCVKKLFTLCYLRCVNKICLHTCMVHVYVASMPKCYFLTPPVSPQVNPNVFMNEFKQNVYNSLISDNLPGLVPLGPYLSDWATTGIIVSGISVCHYQKLDFIPM